MMVKRLFKAGIAISVVAAGILLILLIYSTEPKVAREAAVKRSAMLVTVESVHRGTYRPRIEALGVVEAAQDVVLNSRVDGHIVELGSGFVPGEFVQEGTVLAQIDPSDYLNTLKRMESALVEAQAELDLELGRRDVARKEYTLLGESLSEPNQALVLRRPQLAAAEAKVRSAEAMLDQAKLELERTTIRAPFDAQVLSRNVNVGSEVSTSTELARLTGTQEYWVVVTIPVSRLDHVVFPDQGVEGSPVSLIHRNAWPEGATRVGRVHSLIGTVDGQTRLARLLTVVADPLALDEETEGPPLLIGSVLQVEIEGMALEEVFRIPRDFLRDGNRVWLNREGRLVIADVSVLFQNRDFAYIDSGMENGDLLVTSNLATVVAGTSLRVMDSNGVKEVQE